MAASIEQKQALNVLVVDDEEDVLELFQSALSPRGHKVIVADNGADAVAAATSRHFDVGFIDVAMKPMDGLSTLSRLLAVSPHTEYVMVTAFYSGELPHDVRDSIVSDAMKLGARGCLRKPFRLQTIVQTAEYFGGESADRPPDSP